MKMVSVGTITIIMIMSLSLMVVSSSSSDPSQQLSIGIGGFRGLKSFLEKASDGTNITFDCSPSGPCVPCLYSEKKDVSYRCSETGYRIPMRCAKIDENNNHKANEDSSSSVQVNPEIYVTYRSCIPAANEEKLSVLGFEALMLLLLISSSFAIFRRKGGLVMAMPGAIRLPTNPRF